MGRVKYTLQKPNLDGGFQIFWIYLEPWGFAITKSYQMGRVNQEHHHVMSCLWEVSEGVALAALGAELALYLGFYPGWLRG